MPSLPTILLVLSLPAGAVGYAVAVQVLEALGLADAADGLVALFVPLFVGGLVMLPFLIPFFDRKAKADLAAYRESQAAAGNEGDVGEDDDATTTDGGSPDEGTPTG